MITEVYRINDPENLTDDDLLAIDRAGEVLRRGGLCAFPTETVYGLGASAYDADAALDVFSAKGRPSDNPLIVHVAFPEDAEKFAFASDTYSDLAKRFMPGALTVILPKKEVIPDSVTGGLSTVAVRCPADPIAHELILRAGVPVAAPSANLSGKPSPTTADHVVRDLTGRVEMILGGGDCVFGLESTVLKPEGERTVRILRPGGVTAEMLEDAGYTVITDKAVTDLSAVGENPESPGMKYKHYAPTAEVVLVDASGSAERFTEYVINEERDRDGSYAVMCPCGTEKNFSSSATVYTYAESDDELEMARMLFFCLRAADDDGVGRIYIPLPSQKGMGLAVYNRVIRAAGGKIITV